MVQRTKRVVKQEQEGSNRSLEWSRRYLENRELKKLGRNKSQVWREMGGSRAGSATERRTGKGRHG